MKEIPSRRPKSCWHGDLFSKKPDSKSLIEGKHDRLMFPMFKLRAFWLHIGILHATACNYVKPHIFQVRVVWHVLHHFTTRESEARLENDEDGTWRTLRQCARWTDELCQLMLWRNFLIIVSLIIQTFHICISLDMSPRWTYILLPCGGPKQRWRWWFKIFSTAARFDSQEGILRKGEWRNKKSTICKPSRSTRNTLDPAEPNYDLELE